MNRKPSRGIGVYIVILAMLMMTIYFAVSMMSGDRATQVL